MRSRTREFRHFCKGLFLSFLLLPCAVYSSDTKKVLILVEGVYDLKSPATAEGRMLENLLGHFNTAVDIYGTEKYQSGELGSYDAVFFLGYNNNIVVKSELANELITSEKKIIWLNCGLQSANRDRMSGLGFYIYDYKDNTPFDRVRKDKIIFEKGVSAINYVKITDPRKAVIIASSFSKKTGEETPYIVRSGTFWYVADMPFRRAYAADRYILFADLLHDILEEFHEASHKAIVRIEDVSPASKPAHIRDIAEFLSRRNVPFVISVIPFYVNPSEGIKISLTDKPDLVDALQYAVERGATIAMHGMTHQYKGLTADDYEFWNAVTDKPITEASEEYISNRLEQGIQQFIKNGLYPLLWETPHYTASVKSYNVFARYFTSAIEQPMVIENRNYGQFFPYIIQKDVYGRMVFPENLSYIPLRVVQESDKKFVQDFTNNARMIKKGVRDGVASFYYHAFLGTGMLGTLVDSIRNLGYEFMDLRDYSHKVQASDRAVISGSQTYSITLNKSYLEELYFNRLGTIVKSSTSDERIDGTVSKKIQIDRGSLYIAGPAERRVEETGWVEEMTGKLNEIRRNVFSSGEHWQEARTALVWLSSARGAAYNDQASFVSALKSVSINVDTLDARKDFELTGYNMVIVPYASADSLSDLQIGKIADFVSNGGNVITDRRNKLSEKLGFVFMQSLSIYQVRDKLYMGENILWKHPALTYKVDYSSRDELFCEEINTKAAVVLGRNIEKGKVIYINAAFDPLSEYGYSRFPFLLDYIKTFFHLQPVVKRECLEFYFDPGYRQNISIETLVKQWVKDGIRIIHVAGWHEYPRYTYDYERLIKVAHANGILIFAWLEPPQVSQKFWLDHPEWREKNYKGEDVRPSWRYPVALTDEKCLQAVIDKYTKLLNQFDWDGVNLGECYFETAGGFANPDYFTPMHRSAINDVFKNNNFRINELFERYSGYYWEDNYEYTQDLIKYRIDKVTYFHQRFLTGFSKIASAKPGFQVIVTTMDTYGSPELKAELGLSTEKIIELQKKYGFHLQIEDPQRRWSESPIRYKEMGDFYSKKIDRDKLLLDLNILIFRTPDEITPFPTLIQTGTECFHLINISAKGAPRFTIYGEASLNPQDMAWISYASAADVYYRREANGYTVSSPNSFVLNMPHNIHIISIDGRPVVGMRNNIYIIPAGTHSIDISQQDVTSFSTVELQPQILSFTGNILSASYEMQKVSMSYESSMRALLSLNHKISGITLDGKPYAFELMKGIDCETVFLPQGSHEVVIVTGSKISFGINVTSLWSTTAIVIFGTIAVSLLFVLYIVLKIIRKKSA